MTITTNAGDAALLFNEANSQLSTVRDLLRFAVSRFTEAGLAFGHGTTNAYDEAAYLILATLHLPLDTLDPFLDAKLTSREVAAVVDVLRRRTLERVPAAYLTGEAWLGDFRFVVDERVIVPRSFIAELLRDGLAPWVADADAVGHVLDLCTGSGCLAIVAAHAFPAADVDGVDISADALDVARVNVDEYGLADRVRLVESDLFAALDGEVYDVIVSNPPYVTGESMAALPDEYRHEPTGALAGGDDGLDIVRRILRDAPRHLADGGVLVVEVGDNRDGVDAAFPTLGLTWLETSAGDGYVFLVTKETLGGWMPR